MDNKCISASLALEFPLNEYMRVLLNKREVILNKVQTLIWRELRKHESIQIDELYEKIKIHHISVEEYQNCINNFLIREMAVEVTINW